MNLARNRTIPHESPRRLAVPQKQIDILKQLSFKVGAPDLFDYSREVLEPLAQSFTELGEFPVNGDLVESTVEALMQNLDYGMAKQSNNVADTLKPLVALVSLQPLTPQLAKYYAQVLEHCFSYVDQDEWERAVTLLPNLVLDEIGSMPQTPSPFSERTDRNLTRVKEVDLRQLRGRANSAQAHTITSHIQARIVDATLRITEERLVYAKDLYAAGEHEVAKCMARVAKILFKREKNSRGERECRKIIERKNGVEPAQTKEIEACDFDGGWESVLDSDLIAFSTQLRKTDSLEAHHLMVQVQKELVRRNTESAGFQRELTNALLLVGDNGPALDTALQVLTIKTTAPDRHAVSNEKSAKISMATLGTLFIDPVKLLCKELAGADVNSPQLKQLSDEKLRDAAEKAARGGNLDRAITCYAILEGRGAREYRCKFKMVELLIQAKRYEEALKISRAVHAIVELILRGFDCRSHRVETFEGFIEQVGAINEVRMRTLEVLIDRESKGSKVQGAELAKKGE